MRDGAVPAAIVAAAVIAFVAYVSFEGTSHAVEYAVTGADATMVPAAEIRPPADADQPDQPGASERGRALVVGVSWQAVEEIGGGSYVLLVSVPQGWTHVRCRPECSWVRTDGLREFRRTLRRPTYPLGAAVDAEQSGSVRVIFRATPRAPRRPTGQFAPAAWLVQTDGDDVLGSEQVPLS